jgi:hypothetical protein
MKFPILNSAPAFLHLGIPDALRVSARFLAFFQSKDVIDSCRGRGCCSEDLIFIFLQPQTIAIDAAIPKAESEGMITNLKDVEVYVQGADNTGRSTLYWSGLQEFWARYFKVTGATLKDYSALRDSIILER